MNAARRSCTRRHSAGWLGLALRTVAVIGMLLVAREGMAEPPPHPRAHALLDPVRHAARPPAPVPCLSYAPFRRDGHSPSDPGLEVSRAQIHDDLSRLRPLTTCVRLYGTSHGLHHVPEVARELGMSVVLGAWLSRDEAGNEQELQRALELARSHPDTVRMLIVGNEVLLRREMTPQRLAGWLQRARAASPVPVSYADVWEFWLRHAAVLVPHADVVSIHALPYWEDHPVGADDAARHVVETVEHVSRAIPGLPVWVAETGWPVRGRQRGPAVPGLREQARFLDDLLRLSSVERLDFNFIEAFDQPWKRQLEGTMGGAWGLISADGHIRHASRLGLDQGCGIPRCWPWDLKGSEVGALVAAVWALVVAILLRHGALQAWGAALAVGLLAHHVVEGWSWPRHASEWIAFTVPAVLVAALILRPWRRGGSARMAETALLFILAAQALALALDGRYRMLPDSLSVAVAWLAWWPRGRDREGRPCRALQAGGDVARRFLSGLIAVCAVPLMLQEGVANGQAWAVALGWVALGAAAWIHGRPRILSHKADSTHHAAERSTS